MLKIESQRCNGAVWKWPLFGVQKAETFALKQRPRGRLCALPLLETAGNETPRTGKTKPKPKTRRSGFPCQRGRDGSPRLAREGASMAAADPLGELREETTCPICLQYFADPVLVAGCGHTFCRACLTAWSSHSNACPQCKKTWRRGENFRPNWRLASIVQIAQKLEAERDEGNARGGQCRTHGAPLTLFCKDDQTSICWVCSRSAEHKFHPLLPVEEVDRPYKEKLQAQLKSLKKGKKNLLKQIKDEEQERQACLALLEQEKKKIRTPFEQLHTFLEEKLNSSLAYLGDLEKETKEKHKARVAILSAEYSHLRDLITEVEMKCQQPPSEFLQDIGRTFTRCDRKPMGYMMHLVPLMKERLRICSQKTSALEKIMNNCKESLAWIEKKTTKVNVTLDQDTAHPSLILSDDRKSVIVGDPQHFLPDNPERFDFMHCVLGCEAFNSGSHWWEVEVTLQLKKQAAWAVGVARESVERKGLFILNPDKGIWAVGKPMGVLPSHLQAFTSPKLLPLTVSHNLSKIRVSLNYEEKSVEFSDADTDKMIYTFPSAAFSGKKIRPCFWLCQGAKLSC